MKPALGTLTRVQLREAWLNEAKDFTPWLAQAENLSLLGEAIGIELQPDTTEEPVGPYRADIKCRDYLGNEVLIENQIERTDHSHLGQILTYAAGLKTKTIVWIAQSFTDEHRAALDWLNGVTNKDINFFGLEVELWRIGDSLAAPKFNIVSQPNNWVKTVADTRLHGEVGETRQLQLEYWNAFRAHLADHSSSLTTYKPQPCHWIDVKLGTAGYLLAAVAATRPQFVATELKMDAPDAKATFRLLEQERAAIEAEIGESLLWQELPQRKMSRIRLMNRELDPKSREDWPAQFAWLQDRLEKFHMAFHRRIGTLSEAELDLTEEHNLL